MSEYQHNKYSSFCSHSFHQSTNNEIKLICKDNKSMIHCVSQIGKICNKCAIIINKSLQQNIPCIICSNILIEYLHNRQLCSHDANKPFDEVIVKCVKNQGYHSVPLKTSVCQQCHIKIKFIFTGKSQCAICQGKQQQALENMQRVLSSPTLNYIQDILKTLTDPKIIQKEIQYYCLSPDKDANGNNISYQDNCQSVISHQLRDSYSNTIEDHPSKRYLLYPKCPKHRQLLLKLCNLCIVAVLNLQTCPYGCNQQVKQVKKKENDVKVLQGGFMSLLPKKNVGGIYLQIFVFRQIQERGRVDRWECQLRKSKPNNPTSEKLLSELSLYGNCVQTTTRKYLYCGGKKTLNQSPNGTTLLIQLSSNGKQLSVELCQSMLIGRAAHALAYDSAAHNIYAVGGFIDGKCLKQCQYFNTDSKKWYKMAHLNVQRSKPSSLIYKKTLYIFGGLSANQNISNSLCERYVNDKWQILQYDGFDNPFITGIASSTSIPIYQNHQILLFGGSNYADSTYLIQTLQINQKNKTFSMNSSSSYRKLNYPRCGAQIGLLSSNNVEEKIIIVFGGVQDHQNFLTIDAVKIRTKQQQLNVIFTFDDEIQIGSYRLLLRENAQEIYQEMKQSRIKMGILRQDKLKKEKQTENKEKNNLLTQFNMHLIQNMWYRVGSTFVWVPLNDQ